MNTPKILLIIAEITFMFFAFMLISAETDPAVLAIGFAIYAQGFRGKL